MKISKSINHFRIDYILLLISLISINSCKSRDNNEGYKISAVTKASDLASIEQQDLALLIPYENSPDWLSAAKLMPKAAFEKTIAHLLVESGVTPNDADDRAIMQRVGKDPHGFIRSAGRACISDSSKWKTTGIRIAPYEQYVFMDATKASSLLPPDQRIDLSPSIRLTMKLKCENSAKTQDAGLHVIFRIRPNDEIEAGLAASAADFRKEATSGDPKVAVVKLAVHAAIFSKNDFTVARKEFLRDIARMAFIRSRLARPNPDTYALVMKELTKNDRSVSDDVGFRFANVASRSFVSDNMASISMKDNVFLREFKFFMDKYATERNRSSTALFASIDNFSMWMWAQVNKSGDPEKIGTFATVLESGGIRVKRILNESWFVGNQLLTANDIVKENIDAAKEYEFFTFGDKLEKTDTVRFPESGKRMLDNSHSVASTSCSSCHSLPKHFRNSKFEINGEGENDFHLMGAALTSQLRLTMRTAAETDFEAAQLNSEINTLGLKAADLGDFDDASDSPSNAGGGGNPTQAKFCKVTEEGANVRRKPNGSIIGTASRGTGFMKMSESGSWAKVQVRLGGSSSPLVGAGGVEPEAWIHSSQFTCE